MEFKNLLGQAGMVSEKPKLTKSAGGIKSSKKSFYQYIHSKMLNKDNVGSLLNRVGDLVTADTDKVEISDAFFSPAFTKVSQASLLSERV